MKLVRFIRLSVFVGLLLGLLAVSRPAHAEAAFKVIVNKQNPVASMSRSDASKYFLKRNTTWSDSTKVDPVDLGPEDAARESFSQRVHGKSTRAVRSYWQTQIFSGRATPPPELATDAAVVDFVAANPGAIGYVSEGASVDAVKAVTLSD